MRRSVAVVLNLLLGWLLMLPAFSRGASELSLPACCRKSGKHHCTLTGGSSGTTSLAVSEKCPYVPHPAFSSNGFAAWRGKPRVISVPVVVLFLAAPGRESAVHTGLPNLPGERAPPSFFG